jgi:hypothetical protein
MPIPLGVLAVAGAGAAGGGNSFDLLATTILSSGAASVTFSNLNTYSAYKHLQIRATFRTQRAVEAAVIRMYANGNDALTWSYHALTGNNGSVTSTGSGNDNFHYIDVPGANNTANVFAASVIDILDAGSTSKFKTIRTLTGFHSGTNSALLSEVALQSGAFQTTSALTSLTFFDSSNANLSVGTRLSLYGIK